MISSFVQSHISLHKARPIQVIKAFGPMSFGFPWVPEVKPSSLRRCCSWRTHRELDFLSASLSSTEHVARTVL